MSEIFKAKVRKVGTSLGVLLPKEVTEKENVKSGQIVEIAILKQKNLEELWKAFGSAKGAKPFRRDHRDREF